MLKLLALLLFVGPALAQQPAPSIAPTPQQRAIAEKLMEEINENIQLRAKLLEAQEKFKQSETKK